MKEIIHKRINDIQANRTGNELVGALWAIMALLLVVVGFVAVLLYIGKIYQVDTVCNQITRRIEITGEYDASVARLMIDKVDKSASIEVYYVDNLGNKGAAVPTDTPIQLRQNFCVEIEGRYSTIFHIFGDNSEDTAAQTFSLPYKAVSHGMSEVYYKAS